MKRELFVCMDEYDGLLRITKSVSCLIQKVVKCGSDYRCKECLSQGNGRTPTSPYIERKYHNFIERKQY